MLKIVAYSLGSIAFFFCFFYFYSAQIFEAEIMEGEISYTVDIALKGFWDNSVLPEVVNMSMVKSVKPTLQGTFLLIICLLGLPIMIGYRLATIKAKDENNKTEENES